MILVLAAVVKNTSSVMGKSKSLKVVDVAVGIITQGDRVLVAKRRSHQEWAGCWEFPGGKVEVGEEIYSALCRELKEEVALHVEKATFLKSIAYDYEKYHVILHVWLVEHFSGEPESAEGQHIEWVSQSKLPLLQFPPANHAIIELLNTAQ
jgi:8-oxo-dGTP diphosphatase